MGTATVGLTIDSAFVDGIRQSTILDSAMYAGNKVSATTFTAPEGVTRMIGVAETNSSIQNTVLKEGRDYKGSDSILNLQFLAVY